MADRIKEIEDELTRMEQADLKSLSTADLLGLRNHLAALDREAVALGQFWQVMEEAATSGASSASPPRTPPTCA